jgi:hypothetical protein
MKKGASANYRRESMRLCYEFYCFHDAGKHEKKDVQGWAYKFGIAQGLRRCY